MHKWWAPAKLIARYMAAHKTARQTERVTGLRIRRTGRCPNCGRAGEIVRRQLNTMYQREASNFMVSCAPCYQEAFDYYEERWADYYAGLM